VPHITFHTHSEDQTITLGLALGRLLRPGDILALDGELGAGKTRLVRGLAEGLGLDPAQVSSPTYVLVHEYTQPSGTSGTTGESSRFVETPLYHLDAYRLNGPEDLDTLGWDRIIDSFGIIVIEWGERIAAALTKEPSLARMRIHPEGQTTRRLDLVVPKAWMLRPQWPSLAALADAAPDGALPAGWTRCPVSGQRVAPDCPTFPFANERARLADLGKWLSGSYTVARDLTEDDLTDPDLNQP
jgi:tRNA threonylcarbamoyladenosine biosynthesis protein TsaE